MNNNENNIETSTSRIEAVNQSLTNNDRFIAKLKELNEKDSNQETTERRNRDIQSIMSENTTLLEEKQALLEARFQSGSQSATDETLKWQNPEYRDGAGLSSK